MGRDRILSPNIVSFVKFFLKGVGKEERERMG